MNINALILVLITLSLLTVEIVCNRFIKKVTNTYWFWLAISVFLFVWYITFRFTFQWKELANHWSEGTETLIGSVRYAKGFLLELCPFFCLMTPVALIADPSRKAAQLFAPLSFLTAFIVVIAFFWSNVKPELNIETFFIGADAGLNWKLYEFIHMSNVFLSMGIMLNTPKYGWKGGLAIVGVLGIFLMYVGICMAVTGCHFHVTGLSIDDWILHTEIDPETGLGYKGDFYLITKLFGNNPTLAMCIFFPICGLLFAGFIFLMDKLKTTKWFKYGNAKSKCWWQHYNYEKFVKHKFI